ncbi:hypothetical protein SD70_26180 [Gordoniibacillus kamchatkensis]|uniref:DUF2642 domain-containing protein n=1 Tax=Gordoniibacillus kamchatkensis TaxID=1590651 RepID=A0ABR5ABM2_9BACL|nr:DUF2642 domain-containing protein [Paenibacillus sp. VKM B-2647]KIL38459.1 hypothetical protein SD70_26180 [Paenibacillus sp. VKM B-2647]
MRLETNRSITAMNRKLDALRAGIRRDLRRELYSQKFSSFVGRAVENAHNAQFRDIARQYVNKSVVVTTTAGTVSGTVIRVADDFMAIQETRASQLLVPFRSTASIRPL